MAGHDMKIILVAVCLALLLPGLCMAAHTATEVQVDAGYITPQGDLADGFADTELGFGADPGLEIGFLWRYRFNLRWSLATAFHFVDYSDFKGTDETAGEYKIQASSYRYGLQLRRSFFSGRKLQPFFMAGVGIFRNRVEGRDKVSLEPFDQSLTTLGYSIQVGIRSGTIEAGVVGTFNRFSSWRLFPSTQEQDYNWDSVCLRFSWLIPDLR